MGYKLLVTGKGFAMQWIEKPDGSTVRSSNEEWSFVVESNRQDGVFVEDFLKQTGCKWRKGYSRPSWIMNANGWTVKRLD